MDMSRIALKFAKFLLRTICREFPSVVKNYIWEETVFNGDSLE